MYKNLDGPGLQTTDVAEIGDIGSYKHDDSLI